MSAFDMPAVGTWEERAGWVVHALMRDADLQMHQAAGFMGNPGYESRGFADLQEKRPAVPGSKGGRGWVQWTGYHAPNDRRLQFENWCAAHKLSPESDEANYGFILEELRGRFASFTDQLRKCATIEEACHLTHQRYEVSSDVLDRTYSSGPARLGYAKRALAGALAGVAATPITAPKPILDAKLLAEAADVIARLQAALAP